MSLLWPSWSWFVAVMVHICPLICMQASDIKSQADRLINEHGNLMIDVERQKNETTILLERGYRQQQIADELLADADAARDTARKAVAKAEDTLREANETLRTLRGRSADGFPPPILPPARRGWCIGVARNLSWGLTPLGGGLLTPEWLLYASPADFWAENKDIWRIFVLKCIFRESWRLLSPLPSTPWLRLWGFAVNSVRFMCLFCLS